MLDIVTNSVSWLFCFFFELGVELLQLDLEGRLVFGVNPKPRAEQTSYANLLPIIVTAATCGAACCQTGAAGAGLCFKLLERLLRMVFSLKLVASERRVVMPLTLAI